jgi:hypothetical protein
LKAALNLDWNKSDKGWVEIQLGNEPAQKIEVIETGTNSGIFTAKFIIPKLKKGSGVKVSYGYFGLGVESGLMIN